jgi:hypothetical protein
MESSSRPKFDGHRRGRGHHRLEGRGRVTERSRCATEVQGGAPAAFRGVGGENSRSGGRPKCTAEVFLTAKVAPPTQVADRLVVEVNVLRPRHTRAETVVEGTQLHARFRDRELERYGKAGEARQVAGRHPAPVREGAFEQVLGRAAHILDAVTRDKEKASVKVDQ